MLKNAKAWMEQLYSLNQQPSVLVENRSEKSITELFLKNFFSF